MSKTILSIQDLSVSFPLPPGNISAVDRISFDVADGQSLGIVGESGSGKSVIALSVLNLLPPSADVSGDIKYFQPGGEQETDLLNSPEPELQMIRGRHISMIFQEPMTSLNPVYSCGDQVTEIIRRHLRNSKKEAEEKAEDLFGMVELPNPGRIFKSYPHELSGGQRQRVMIAMAISCDPEVLIADEPTTALDVTIQLSILKLLRDLRNRYGMSLIFISHDLAVVSQVADEIVVMYNGRIAERGEKQQIIHSPQNVYTRGLIACKPPLDKRPERLFTLSDFTGGTAGKVQVKDDNTYGRRRSGHPDGSSSVVFNLQDVSKYFVLKQNFFGKTLERLNAISHISLKIFRGETLGLVGESGSGKSTLARVLLKLLPFNYGLIEFEGRDFNLFDAADLREFRQKVQIIFQDPYSTLNPRLSIGKMITEPLEYYGYYARQSERRIKAIELLNDVKLGEEYFNRYPHELSGGQRQRVAIARVLALSPELIICDEAVSALDVSIQAEILNLLQDLKKAYNLTYVFITHDFSVVRFMSDRVAVVKEGSLVEIGKSGKVFESPENEYTRKLLSSVPVI